jgi:molybdate transport system substrate-binding protein
MLVRLLLVALIVALAATAPAQAATVTVFAAASLKEALDAHARAFQAATGDRVVVSYAASNALAKQIDAGAPADLFIAADHDWMDYLEQRKRLLEGTRVDLLSNALVLIAPASSRATLGIAPSFPLAAALGSERLAMAHPDSVPAGKYGKRALESLGVWTAVEKQVARADSVRAALALVSRGEAPFGIVYRTDAMADKGVRIVDTFPARSHPPIVYPAARIAEGRSPAAAKALLDHLRSPAAAAVWQSHGFGMVR